MIEDTYEDDDDAGAEALGEFLRTAVAEILREEDPAAFLAWMRDKAPQEAPELFADLPDAEARRGFATELGRSLWNAIPLPGNGFRTRPLPKPERNEPCPCGSGKKHKKCCAEWASQVPELAQEDAWRLTADVLSLEQVEALGESGRVPRSLVGDLATALLDDGDSERALALVRPLFRRPEKLDERDAAALNTLLEAYDDLELDEEKEADVARLSKALRPSLRVVMWENLTRSLAVQGEMEGAWQALEKAREDDPQSPALGPLEVSLLLAEGRMDEAGERAGFWRERLSTSELTEEGIRFLDRVAVDPERAQLEFSLGEGVADRLRDFQTLLGRAPQAGYGIEDLADDPGAARLAGPEAFSDLEARWQEVFDPSFPVEGMESDEQWDAWDEENAEGWLAFLLENPAALDSLPILDEVADAFGELALDLPAVDRSFLQPLVDRGFGLFERALEGRPADVRLPWSAEPNDAVHGLLATAADLAQRQKDAERAQALWDRKAAFDPTLLDE